uniref:NADH-ubiquinone oxidoreductase chain 2 n=1 Tax=Parcoblatta pensylvanica TaxID=37813 RepID=A0A2P1H810_9NEOP|nr:NADH dehydrogenase subunit 2 [Parcoblatta pensylvanica]
MLFMTTMVSGAVITVSSNSWLGAWMGLEINLLSFIPIMSSNQNIYTTEASLKYFLIQALASSILLFLIISKTMINDFFYMFNSTINSTIMTTPLLLKSGAAPFHWWFPSVMEGLSWINCFLLLTIQKIAPLTLISYTLMISFFSTIIIISSVFIGSIGGYNQISIRKIITYSSINHMGWMLSALLLGNNFWLTYFSIYSMLTLAIILIVKPFQVSFINQTFLMNNNNTITKFLLFTSLLSLGGLPPFLGFLPKWVIIQNMVANNMFIIVTIMVVMSLITLYYYLRICYSSFIMLHFEPSWNTQSHNNFKMFSLTVLLSITSMIGLILCSILFSIF